MKQLIIAIRVTLVLAIVTGVAYPLLVTGLSQLLFPHQANGSLTPGRWQDRRIGTDRPAVHQAAVFPRPPLGRRQRWLRRHSPAGGASNYGPTNQKLVDRVQADMKTFRAENPTFTGPVPADLLTTSASGLDPDISPASAEAQAGRVAAARGMTVDALRQLIAAHTQGRQFGILGEPRVNVLQLNLALDEATRK